jgi:iron complex transport system ATP-binding protein
MGMILDVTDAAFSYDGERMIFEEISLSIGKGECLCILGPNGTGKSTLIKCLVNLMPLNQGNIRLNGADIAHLSRPEIATQIAYVPQGHQVVFPFSVEEYVLMGRSPHLSVFRSPGDDDRRIAGEALDTVGIRHLAARPVSEISGGELQLVLIARALAQQPAVMILDEPTSHLDFGNQVRVLRLIERLVDDGIAVVMSSHFPDHSFIIPQRVAIMKDRRFIAVGDADDVVTPDFLRQAYGIDVTVMHVEEVGRRICVPSATSGRY